MASGQRTLVLRGGAIGDFVLTLPVLTALRAHFPSAPLAVLGRPHIVPLAQAGGLADEVRSVEDRRLAGFFIRGGPLDPEWAAFFSSCDIVVSYLFDPEGVFRENLRRCSQARIVEGPHRPDESQPIHATDVYLRPLESLGLVGLDPVPRLRLRPEGSGQAKPPQPARRVLALHPGSGSERKNWPEDRWGALIDALLSETDSHLLLVGGEAEGKRIERLATTRPAGRVERAEQLPLVELARRLSECAALVGHDSGISHLAAALGLPGVALWGDTVEAVWRPRSDRWLVLRDPAGLPALPVSRVMTAAKSLLTPILQAPPW
jgi:ADP-heptose:LPS heptosyltransferase